MSILRWPDAKNHPALALARQAPSPPPVTLPAGSLLVPSESIRVPLHLRADGRHRKAPGRWAWWPGPGHRPPGTRRAGGPFRRPLPSQKGSPRPIASVSACRPRVTRAAPVRISACARTPARSLRLPDSDRLGLAVRPALPAPLNLTKSSIIES